MCSSRIHICAMIDGQLCSNLCTAKRKAFCVYAMRDQNHSQAGMYSMDTSGVLTKKSFGELEVPGFGNTKKVPTIESFFPFSKNNFDASGKRRLPCTSMT